MKLKLPAYGGQAVIEGVMMRGTRVVAHGYAQTGWVHRDHP